MTDMDCDSGLRFVVALTGASGAIYGIDLVARLLAAAKGASVYCAATPPVLEVMSRELGVGDVRKAVAMRMAHIGSDLGEVQEPRLRVFAADDFDAPLASGSFYFDAMAVSPCSMNTLGKCAAATADNIIVRAAEAALRERRRLVLVPRETPLALTHLRNMATLSEAGAVILPACPAFYRNPQSVDDLVDFITFRTMSAMGIRGGTMREWGDEK